MENKKIDKAITENKFNLKLFNEYKVLCLILINLNKIQKNPIKVRL